ncbi:MAG: tetratricopeptide repeat protein [Spirosomataceae bacterium]
MKSRVFTISVVAIVAASCSQFSNNPVSKAWHNTNAKFNSLIIAREGMKYAEKGINRNYTENYSGLLPVLMPIDSTLLESSGGDALNFGNMGAGGLGNANSGGLGQSFGNTQVSENSLRRDLGNGNSASISTFGNSSGGLNTQQNRSSGFQQTQQGLGNVQNGLNAAEDIGKKTGFDILTGSPKTQIDEVIKKTSLIAERHSNSKYLDEAYLLLGKARMYKGDFLNAIEIFKYLNTTGKDENQKHAAMIWLMRAYTEQKDYPSALKVAESLKESNLNDKNTADYYLVKAYLHQRQEEYPISVAIIEEALKLMSKSEKKARVHFAAGQMYDYLKRPDLALPHYQAVANNRPNYDLEFYARLNALLASASKRGSSVNIQESFAQMLKDRKNSDLKDKIYATMGKLEVKKGDYQKAIQYFNSSIQNATNNPTQKAFSYLELAELHYNQLQKYSDASLYYDSTLVELPKNSPDYERITRRAMSLSDFVKYRNTIILEDSLQKLAAMNPLALDQTLERAIKQKQEEEKKQLELAQKLAAKSNTAAISVSNSNEKRWVLYDPIQVSRGKTEFMQIWGSRQLDDNWRRRDKEAGSISVKIERSVVGSEAPKVDSQASKEEAEKQKALAEAKAMEDKKKEMMAAIPTTPEKLAASKKKVEEAYYHLGKIYKLQFNEPDNARDAFTTLLFRFPETQHEPEALYFLTLLSDNQASSPFRQTLMTKYPTSTYARQLLRGNTQVTSDTESKAHTVYSQAFKMYENESFDSALIMAEEGLVTYTGTSIEDKFAMLRIILLAKTEKKELYVQGLKDFIQGYPSSNLLAKAVQMLSIVDTKN